MEHERQFVTKRTYGGQENAILGFCGRILWVTPKKDVNRRIKNQGFASFEGFEGFAPPENWYHNLHGVFDENGQKWRKMTKIMKIHQKSVRCLQVVKMKNAKWEIHTSWNEYPNIGNKKMAKNDEKWRKSWKLSEIDTMKVLYVYADPEKVTKWPNPCFWGMKAVK